MRRPHWTASLPHPEERMRILALSGVMPTIQTDLLKGLEVNLSDDEKGKIDLERIWDDGHFAGLSGHTPADRNKYLQGSEAYDTWHRGWVAGQSKLVTEKIKKPAKAPPKPRRGKQGAQAANDEQRTAH